MRGNTPGKTGAEMLKDQMTVPRVALWIVAFGLFLGCGGDPSQPDQNTGDALRVLAAPRGLIVGAFEDGFSSSFDPPRYPLQTNDQYRALFAEQFNAVIVNVGMDAVQPNRGDDGADAFAYVDSVLNFAEVNNMKVFLEHLVWSLATPAWVEQLPCQADTMKTILRQEIEAVVSRYSGRIYAYSVVNEIFAEEAGNAIRNDVWMRCIGPEYVELAFRWANAADPNARLYLNEYNSETTTGEPGWVGKSDSVFALVSRLKTGGVPIHGVGLQMHIDIGGNVFRTPPETAGLAENMNRLAAAGLDVYITEMDVAIFNGSGSLTEKLRTQADVYGDVLGVCLSRIACKAFMVWGLTDTYSWVYDLAQQTQGYRADPPDEAPLLFDERFAPKPSFYAVQGALVP